MATAAALAAQACLDTLEATLLATPPQDKRHQGDQQQCEDTANIETVSIDPVEHLKVVVVLVAEQFRLGTDIATQTLATALCGHRWALVLGGRCAMAPW